MVWELKSSVFWLFEGNSPISRVFNVIQCHSSERLNKYTFFFCKKCCRRPFLEERGCSDSLCGIGAGVGSNTRDGQELRMYQDGYQQSLIEKKKYTFYPP